MNCKEYKRLYNKIYGVGFIGSQESITDEETGWHDHFQECDSCSDWTLANQIRERGFNPDDYPCVHIGNYLTLVCDKHPNPRDCSRALMGYSAKYNEYFIYDRNIESSAVTIIEFCPWCGVKLPDSKRDQWCRELEELGVEEPLLDETIPERYKSDKWHKGFH